jgi:hypothetical protein|tara:strand:- start:890 stop:1168 length:279 start_codon:yes stop_codon:yes gene_type:complete
MTKRFFDWLWGRSDQPPKSDLDFDFAADPRTFVNVPKWTRVGRSGQRDLCCPHCGFSTIVHDFGWVARICAGCSVSVDKYHWLIEVQPVHKD